MGRLSYSSKIKVTQEAAAAAPSKLELEQGEEITVIDAIKALVTKSANDMAVALAAAHRRHGVEFRPADDARRRTSSA